MGIYKCHKHDLLTSVATSGLRWRNRWASVEVSEMVQPITHHVFLNQFKGVLDFTCNCWEADPSAPSLQGCPSSEMSSNLSIRVASKLPASEQAIESVNLRQTGGSSCCSSKKNQHSYDQQHHILFQNKQLLLT